LLSAFDSRTEKIFVTEKEIIDETYENTIRQLCTQLFSTLLLPNNGTPHADAETRFENGVRHGREVRNRASQLLP
jgi:hypothetical protein